MSVVKHFRVDPDFRAGNCPLKFTLTFDGSLRTSQKGRNQQKSALRKHFHEQMKRLWEVNPFLANWSVGEFSNPVKMQDWVREFVPVVNGIKFIPLIIPALAVECALEFRILRSTERTGNVADADNQIKVFLDALKMPQNAEEIGDCKEYADYNPMFTLVQDDKLITRIVSISDEMLSPPSGWDQFEPSLCRVQIDVFIRPRMPKAENAVFFDNEHKPWDHRYNAAIPDGLVGMTNDQLKATTTQLIFRIQALSASFENYSGAWYRMGLSAEDAGYRDDIHQENKRRIWETEFWPRAFAVREELCRRIYGEPPYPTDAPDPIAISFGALAGPRPISDAATALERLLLRLI